MTGRPENADSSAVPDHKIRESPVSRKETVTHYERPAPSHSWHDLHRWHGGLYRKHQLHWDFVATRSTDWRRPPPSTALPRGLSSAAHLLGEHAFCAGNGPLEPVL